MVCQAFLNGMKQGQIMRKKKKNPSLDQPTFGSKNKIICYRCTIVISSKAHVTKAFKMI